MKTAIYIRSLLQGGAEKQAILLCEELQSTNDIYFIVHSHSYFSSNLDFSNIKNVIFLNGNILQKTIKLFFLLRNIKVTNLICFLPVNNILGTSIGRLAGVKNIICGIRGSKNKGRVKTVLMRFICNKMNIKFISNNFLSRDIYIKRGFNSENIFVIHNGIRIPDNVEGINKNLIHKEKYTLLSIGRFIPEKDYFTLLNTISYLVKDLNFSNIKLNLIGYGLLQNELINEVEALGLTEYIEFHDGSNCDISHFFRKSHLFLSTSIHEGMPNTVMEAMTYKLPVVTTDAGDVKYLVIDDFNGHVIEKKNYKTMAYKIFDLLSNDEKYEEFSSNSFNHIKANFTTENMAKSFLSYCVK